MEPSEGREESEEREGTVAAAAGCLIAALATATGFGVWLHGARPGLHLGVEDPVDFSLLYVELPCMLAGFPLLTLLTWSLSRAVLRGRGGRGPRRVVKGAVVVLTLSLLSWTCTVWLDHRIDQIRSSPCAGPPC
ncbi:hypothetical protein HCC61_25625 [Streptomyces sp. HNM0575]|uniref:hypothetical protein n=1 Tax=Streptomyces sp. HNM0575 TaxID=2716338 RepID=UPI00145E599F|nr:hypothetical protein [Streptomyces sp. HNM0575]NLU75990.1 hypothetical protein [Streptomyces sp. HNM0575]